MKLISLLSKIKTKHEIKSGDASCTVTNIAIDSRLVKKGDIFFALLGKTQDGSKFISDAIAKGASVIVSTSDCHPCEGLDPVVLIKTSDVFALLVETLKEFYAPLPANIYAITGTNGKTSTAEFTRQILQFLGKKSASIGTLGIRCDADIESQLQSSSLTTPDIVSLYKNLSILKKNGVDDVAIEVSSIGLEQGRIAGLEIDVGAFTNFTQDHLDYHKSMVEYFRCKMILFSDVLPNGSNAVLNADILQFDEIKKICEKKNHHIIDYGFKAEKLRIKKIEHLDLGQRVFFELDKNDYKFDLATSGDFQAFNALCALGNVLTKNKISQSDLQKILPEFSKLQPAAGRMQRVAILKNKAQVFIDFAHSPDALENVLNLARQLSKRVVVLFGCGGDRDAKKRPIMGEIASRLADLIIVTDDNPRSENPAAIRSEILATCDAKKTIEIDDRKLAIEKAISILEPHDILILAGKGHEKYQIIGEKKFEFDEEKIVKNVTKTTS
jgi:UDP-N-acetylmuramoyl-L-alanyl-D-glutamate--2,6-diaminopimelate ligase